jgi:phosphate-selective porin OprO and OprP
VSATDSESRLTAVEEQLEKLLQAQSKWEAKAAQKPTFQIGGMIHIDYLWIGQNEANRLSVGDAEDTVDFRRARLTGRGEAYEIIEYAIGFDFANAGRPSLLDNYVAVRDLPLLGNVLVGHYFEPFSLERYTQARNNTFSERSLPETFAPARNLGIMARNTIGEEERGTWAVGWFRSNSDNFGDDFTDEGGHAVTTRVSWLPLYDEANDGRSLVHLGLAYTYRAEAKRELRFQSLPEARAGAPNGAGIPPFVDTGVMSAQSDERLGAEFALIHGPLYVQAEYITSSVEQIGGPRLSFHSAYAFVSYFLTGENRTYNKSLGTMDRVYPFENFFRVATDHGVETGCGAWEVAARWSYIDLDSHNIQGGTLSDITLGLNWHLNPHTRMRWEYIHAQLNRAPVGDSFAQIVGMRFDIDF